MKDNQSPFAAIFAGEDKLGLLEAKPASPTRSTEDEIAIAQFEAINAFIDEHKVFPGSTKEGREPNLSEYTLESHLETFRSDDKYRTLLGPCDRHGLFGPAAAATSEMPTTMADILASKNPLLSGPADHIFDLRNVPDEPQAKASPEDIAKRRQCEEFETFAPIFALLKKDLAEGKRVAERFKGESTIKVGASYILNGIISYVADISAVNTRLGRHPNTRIRVIFDNGTESNHLLSSFARQLHDDENGRQIMETNPAISGPLFSGQPEQGDDFGVVAGTVYIVESLSKDPQIAALHGRLYKIGFTTQPIMKRLANAEKEAAFLYAPVHLLQTFDTNFNPYKLEQLIHQFFGNARLQMDISLGKVISPQEWFVVPRDLVEEAVKRIIDRSILNYRYDHISRKIVQR